MNLQEIYNKTALHLLNQNTKAMRGIFCAYRTFNHLKCAIGCHIPDDKYDPAMEGKDWYGLTKAFPEIIKSLEFDDPQSGALLKHLQRVHDHYEPIDWPTKLRVIAADYSLNTDVVDNFVKDHNEPSTPLAKKLAPTETNFQT